ncbi:MAG: hypothetical protein HRT88_06460 [Lentisphaeraceae bacterium]|nr:hypothetical protein [Lentisphaeraceae bacterium]
MAELELSRNKIDRSNSYLTKLIRNHPQHPLTSKTFLKFYHILKKQKEWDRALYLAYQVANVNIENNTKLKLVEDLGLQEGSLLNQLNLKNPRTKKFIESIITSAKAQNTYDQSLILYAQSCYQLQLGNYYEADIKFSKYLRTPSFQKYNETIYYNYLLSSVKAKQPPIIRALRSRLYLNNHFDRNRSQTVMLHLMDAYFDMGLWEESIAAAKKIFNSEIKRMGIEKDHYKASDEWLKAIARIGQSYHFNDQDNKAQELFSIFTKQFKASPNAAEIFVDWAATAAQHRPYESIERLDVIIPHINNSADFLRLTSLRNVKRLELNIEKSRSEAYNLLKLLKEKNKLLDTRTKKDLSLQIHKALFNNTITYYPEDIDKIKEILLSSVKEFPQDTWPYASILQWHTKSTNKENKKTINNIISKLKSGPAPAHDNIQSTEALKKHTELLKALEGKNLF